MPIPTTDAKGLRSKFWRAFVLQAGLISMTVILGIYASRYVLGDILLEQALQEEAAHYWRLYKQNATYPRPNTHNLIGYLSQLDTIPQRYSALPPGFHHLQDDNDDIIIVYVSSLNNRTLYLEFDSENVGTLALVFGVVPLSILLIVIYLSSWILYRFSQRAISPIILLAESVKQFDPKRSVKTSFTDNNSFNAADDEVRILAKALDDLIDRLQQFVERERNFTRDASHELRSPITVVKMATDMLKMDAGLSDQGRVHLDRISRAARDMEGLIEALLLLARESEHLLTTETVCINDLIDEEIDRANLIFNNKDLHLEKIEDARLSVETSERVLSVLIGNLIRNACAYTDNGRITVLIGGSSVEIRDTGSGIERENVPEVFKPFQRGKMTAVGGHGVGLTIVKMLSQRFNWPIHIDSEPGVGTRVKIEFPHSTNAPINS